MSLSFFSFSCFMSFCKSHLLQEAAFGAPRQWWSWPFWASLEPFSSLLFRALLIGVEMIAFTTGLPYEPRASTFEACGHLGICLKLFFFVLVVIKIPSPTTVPFDGSFSWRQVLSLEFKEYSSRTLFLGSASPATPINLILSWISFVSWLNQHSKIRMFHTKF